MEVVKKWLRANGYKFEVQPFGIAFKYQGGHFIIGDNSDDEDYLQILMPFVYTLEDPSEKEKALQVCNEMNRNFKCLKVYFADEDSIWLAIEMFTYQTTDFDSLMERLLDILHAGRMEIYAKLQAFSLSV
jgi:hypothetical protein